MFSDPQIKILLSIYYLNKSGLSANNKTIASLLELSESSISRLSKQLQTDGIIQKAFKGELLIAPASKHILEPIIEKYTKSRNFLMYSLKIDDKTAHTDAMNMTLFSSDLSVDTLYSKAEKLTV